jgi:hypothetical protein
MEPFHIHTNEVFNIVKNGYELFPKNVVFHIEEKHSVLHYYELFILMKFFIIMKYFHDNEVFHNNEIFS